jgi:hypothetical protein
MTMVDAYAILRHAAAHSRHCLAHAASCASDFIFSHSVAQASQAFAQASQAASASVHERATSFTHNPQKSWQLIAMAAQAACSLRPLAKWVTQ